MTTKQAQKIAKALLPDLPGFISEKKMILMSPADDFLRTLYFENTSDANYFHLHVFFLPLYVPTDYIYFNYGNRIGNALNWRLDNPNLLADLNAVIRSEAIPFLNNVLTREGVLRYLKASVEFDRQRVNPHTLEAFAYTLVRNGDYAAGLEVLAEFKQRFEQSDTPWIAELLQRTQLIEGKLLQNPETALAQLEAWKAETVNKLGLEKYIRLQ